jgi:NADPH:quinone reductase
VVYDAGGRDTFEMSLDMLATRGTLVLYGQSSGQVAAGRLSPRIAGRLPLSRSSEAHALLADRKVLGKILLQA